MVIKQYTVYLYSLFHAIPPSSAPHRATRHLGPQPRERGLARAAVGDQAAAIPRYPTQSGAARDAPPDRKGVYSTKPFLNSKDGASSEPSTGDDDAQPNLDLV